MNKFNTYPEAWREISNKEFTHAFFSYQKEPLEYRQMYIDKDDIKIGMCHANLFVIKGTRNQYGEDGLGLAMFEVEQETKFAKFGSEENWQKFQSYIASQFSGDNS
jgi:hypothetical protein